MGQKKMWPGVFVLVLLLTWVGVSEAAANGPVLKPKPGSVVKAKPQQVKLKVGKRGIRRVVLNGVDLTRDFRAEKGTVRTVVAGASHGLRHGVNRLRVAFKTGKPKVKKVRFRVRGQRPLAGAGRDVRRTVGHISLLNGLRSRPHRRAGKGLRYKWKPVRAPKGSHLRKRLGQSKGSIAQGVRLRFRPKARPRPHLIADAPGIYVFELKVKDRRGLTGTDRVRIAVDPLPSVEIDTMDSAGKGEKKTWGIRIGDQLYPAQSNKWAQIVVVDLSNLELKMNKSYDCPGANGAKANEYNKVSSCLAQIDKDVRPFYNQKQRYAIIASNHPAGPRPVVDSPAWNNQPPVGLDAALTLFTFNPSRWSPSNGTLRRGRLSVIVLTPGGGSFKVRRVYRGFKDLSQINRVGRITGRLSVGTDGLYSYQPIDPVRVDTQPEGPASESRIKVGDKTFTQPTAGARGGFHVLAIDADEPNREFDGQQAFFATGSTGFDPATDNSMRERLDAMLAFLKTHTGRADRLVVVATRGNPAMKLNAGSAKADDLNNVIFQIVDQFERLGATRNAAMPRFYSHLECGGCSYVLIGPGGRGTAGQTTRDPGTEITSDEVADPAGPSKVRAGFNLARTYGDNAFGILGDTLPGEASELGAKLTALLNEEVSDWPEDTPARAAAVRQIGRDVFSTPSPRTRYWTVPYSFESWSSDQKAIAKYCKSATPGDGTNASALKWACDQLSDEIDWLTTVNGRLRSLALPFRSQSVSNWAELEAVTNDIRTQVGLGESDLNRKTRTDVGLGIEIGMKVGSKIPGVGKGFEAIEFLYEVSMAAAEIGTVEVDQEGVFESTVGQTGKELVRRMNRFQATIDSQIPDQIVSDYRRLRMAGLCLAGRKECATDYRQDADDWQITKQQLEGAAKAFPYGMRASAYSALLPARYNLWRIRDGRFDSRHEVEIPRWHEGPVIGQPCPADKFNQAVIGSVVVLGNFYPFANATPQGRLQRHVYVDAPRNRSGVWPHQRTNLWDILGLGYLTGNGTINSPFEMHVPTEKALAPLFDEVKSDDLDHGGLGVDPEAFYMASFTPVPLGGKSGENETYPQKYPYRDNGMTYDESLCHTGS